MSAPAFLGLRTVVYHVPDLARAREWYRAVLGHDPYFDQPFYVGFNVAGFELGLDPDPSGAKAGPGGAVAYWGVEHIESAWQRLLALGSSLSPPRRFPADPPAHHGPPSVPLYSRQNPPCRN